jgi:hypothetical protein
VGSIIWGSDLAEACDKTCSATFEPSVLASTVDLLGELSSEGRAKSTGEVERWVDCRAR